ncbi:MAG: 3-isopropylmalate dehydratase small subunit [Xanthomonadales bacterium]|nr:3-isopropylmalate dehydratase small subunit [Xanthomonadales bacterium]
MKAFTKFQGRVAPLNRANVDTDAIMPKQFLKAITREGLGPFLFDSWRYLDEGELGQNCADRPVNRDFVLNDPRYRDAGILLARENFGCGSSREHAVWGLMDAGFRAVIATSFADIFYNNAIKNGLLPVALPEDRIETLFEMAGGDEALVLEVDLEGQVLRSPKGWKFGFEIDPAVRKRLLEGVDDIALSLAHAEAIRDYERRRAREAPWLFPDRPRS